MAWFSISDLDLCFDFGESLIELDRWNSAVPSMTEPRRLSFPFDLLGVVGGGPAPPREDGPLAKARSPPGMEVLRIGNISWTSAKSESTLSILERRRRVLGLADLSWATGLPLGLAAAASSAAALAATSVAAALSVSAMGDAG